MTVIHGDCLEVMATLDAESVDAIVTDPPYGIGFMGKAWDGPAIAEAARKDAATRKSVGPASASRPGRTTARSSSAFGSAAHYAGPVRGGRPWQEWCEAWAAAALRVATPGAFLLAFGGTRTVHRMTCAIEDAGWIIRDMLVWAYATGFPKSLNVGRSIDTQLCCELGAHNWNEPASDAERAERDAKGDLWHVCPITPQGAASAGDGTALKPAWEPIVMARKPLRGTVAANVLGLGTGALNIAGCRIGTADDLNGGAYAGNTTTDGRSGSLGGGPLRNSVGPFVPPLGRWPANVILTDPIFDGGWDGVVGGGDQDSGPRAILRDSGSRASGFHMGASERETFGDSGTYSRFFLIPKAARRDREPVLGGLPLKPAGTMEDDAYSWDGEIARGRKPRNALRSNNHPTVKPVDLMRHLVRLVTPSGGTVLDPFLGSGTTALAAEMEGFAWVGIERESEYVAIAEARLNGTQKGLAL